MTQWILPVTWPRGDWPGIESAISHKLRRRLRRVKHWDFAHTEQVQMFEFVGLRTCTVVTLKTRVRDGGRFEEGVRQLLCGKAGVPYTQ